PTGEIAANDLIAGDAASVNLADVDPLVGDRVRVERRANDLVPAQGKRSQAFHIHSAPLKVRDRVAGDFERLDVGVSHPERVGRAAEVGFVPVEHLVVHDAAAGCLEQDGYAAAHAQLALPVDDQLLQQNVRRVVENDQVAGVAIPRQDGETLDDD